MAQQATASFVGAPPADSPIMLEVNQLKVYFESNRGLFEKKKFVKAVDGISFKIPKGETMALVGESGSGKTTTARTIVRLVKPTSGTVKFCGEEIHALKGSLLKAYRRKVQYIFQDPYESLNPRQTVFDSIATPIRVQKLAGKEEINSLVTRLLLDVNLNPQLVKFRYPHELSGGQRQRVNIARALATRPELIIADEPVSMLDVSLRLGILNLLKRLAQDRGLTLLFITHDMAAARQICSRIAVMYLGKIVETGTMEQVIDFPIHPYTKLLVAATPELITPQKKDQDQKPLKGLTAAKETSTTAGCRFYSRCSYSVEKCKQLEPALIERSREHFAACDVVPV